MLDTLIRGAKIVDGTGKAAFTADVGILDGMIEAVGNLSGAQVFETIEAAGRVLTPGFIDMHRHADAALFREGFGEAELCQGLTTLVNGNCGMSLAPLHRSGVPICVHMRQEGDGVVDALREMLEVARALQTPLEVSHLKAIGSRNA